MCSSDLGAGASRAAGAPAPVPATRAMRRFLDGLYEASGWAAGLGMVAILAVTLLQVLGGFTDLYVRGTDAYAASLCADLAAPYASLTLIIDNADTLTEDLKQGEQAYYRMLVRAEGKQLGGQRGHSIQLQPGMTVTVEVKTGKNTVLRYLAKPIVKTVREAMVEVGWSPRRAIPDYVALLG